MKRTLALAKFKFNPLLILLGLNIIVLGLGFTEFFAPISGDTSIYAYYGRQIAAGQVLYRDLWDFKSPGVYYLFALLFKVFPDSLTTLRLFVVACNIFSSYLVYRIGRLYFKNTSSLIGSGIFLLATNLGGYLNQDGPYPETFVPILGLLGFYFFSASRERNHYQLKLLLSGIFAGLLFVMKQTSLSFAGGVFLFYCLDAHQNGWEKAKRSIFFFVGVVLAIAPWLLYFRMVGAWSDFWNSVILYPFIYLATTSLTSAIQNLIALVSSAMVPLGIIFLLALAGILLRIKTDDQIHKSFRIILPWLFTGMILICSSGRFYERYLMEILIPIIMLATFSINELFNNSLSSSRLGILKYSLGSMLIIGIVVQQAPRLLHMGQDRILSWTPTRSELLDEKPWFWGPNKTVFAWGDPRIPYVTGMPSSVKWLNIEPFLTNCTDATNQVVDDLLLELVSHPPTYFIESPARPLISQSCLQGTPVFDFLEQKYEFFALVGDASVYVLRAGQ